MKFVTRPPIGANGAGHGGDDLDEVLSAFFRSEMPRPWPLLKLPNGTPPAPQVRLAPAAPTPSRRPWFRSPRFALAASVALLIAGSAALSAALSPPSGTDATRLDDSGKAKAHDPGEIVPPDDEGVGVDFESLNQVGNSPTTIHLKAFEKK